jgi:hypothetical protein
MPKAKIIYVKFTGDYYDDEIKVGSDDWEEVTEEELDILQKWYHRLPMKFDGYPRLLIQSTEPIRESMLTLRQFIEKEKKAEEKAKKEREERKARLAAKALETKKKQLEKLKKELGES